MTNDSSEPANPSCQAVLVTKLEKLLAEIDDQLMWFDTESKKHKRLHRVFRYSVFILTGLSTALAGAAIRYSGYQSGLNLTIVITTALTGILTSIEGLRKPEELWINERTIYYSLLDLKRDLEFETADGGTPDLKSYFNQLQAILASSREKWLNHRKPPASDINQG